jgi:hypothetical protein
MIARNNGIERGGFCDLICSIGASVSISDQGLFICVVVIDVVLSGFLEK